MQFQVRESDDSCQPGAQYTNPRVVVQEHHGAPLLNCSGLVLVRQLIERLGVARAIDAGVRVLRRCKWYRESEPVGRVVKIINPILRGWVNYFAIGHSSRCFGRVRNWVEKKIRRHMMRAKKRQGFGWKRWSRSWLYERLGLYGDYRVRWPVAAAKALPTR